MRSICVITELFLLASPLVYALPFDKFKRKMLKVREFADYNSAAYTADIHIHESCDQTQSAFLRDGLNQMSMIAQHAQNRILRLGANDTLYQRYFGEAPITSAVGFYDALLSGDKTGVLLRCDDPDGNCALSSSAGPWAGHWRGNNATLETVICPPTYNSRWALQNLCSDGHLIGNGSASQWLSTDLMHRMTHIPKIFFDSVHHYSDDYGGVLELAVSNASSTVFNQNTFQFYAIHAYAEDMTDAGDACVFSAASLPSASPSAPLTSPTSPVASCHTHSDGTQHCEDDHQSDGVASNTASTSDCHTHSDGTVHCS